MPAGDRTGPAGFGPMSGRAAGYCAGYDVPGYANPWGGRGLRGGYGFGWRWGGGRGAGFGWGRGMGWRWGYPGVSYPYASGEYRYPAAEDEIKWLRNDAKVLEKELDQIRQRIEDLEKSEQQEK